MSLTNPAHYKPLSLDSHLKIKNIQNELINFSLTYTFPTSPILYLYSKFDSLFVNHYLKNLSKCKFFCRPFIWTVCIQLIWFAYISLHAWPFHVPSVHCYKTITFHLAITLWLMLYFFIYNYNLLFWKFMNWFLSFFPTFV